MIAAAGVGMDRPEMPSVAARVDRDGVPASRPGTSLAAPMANAGQMLGDKSPSGTDLAGQPASARKVERAQSKTRRDHPTHQSHSSRSHRDDQKTVGEYALHVLFTSVGLNLPFSHISDPLTL